MLFWDIYEIRCDRDTLHGVKLRGRIRKSTIENQMPCLVENACDQENVVRFALLEGEEAEKISAFIQNLVANVSITNPLVHKVKLCKATPCTVFRVLFQ